MSDDGHTRSLVRELSPERMHKLFWKMYETGRWEPETRELIYEVLQPGDLFVDVGAWIGPVTLWALERGADVIAIEPDPVALPELRRRVPESVEIWEGAVAVRPGLYGLTVNRDFGLGKSISRLAPEGEVTVQAWTLPQILDGRVPALVKVDIEGYETELLPAIVPFLAEMGTPLQVALHGTMPEHDWFGGYGEVTVPSDPHGTVVAKP
jgi:FkbM family methyltransferase